MSALGQKQTYALQQAMSALHPKADMCGATSDVCFGPIADIRSLDDYIHALHKSVGDVQAQRLRSLEVDGQLVLSGLLNGYVFRALALKNPLYKFRAVPNRSRSISSE